MPAAILLASAVILHAFGSTPNDGANPYGGLIFGPNGVLYGTTNSGGGPAGNGTVFSLTPPDWTEKILWTPPAAYGINPYSTLAMDAEGRLYGTLFGGGLSTNGAVFLLKPPDWTAQLLYLFKGAPDGGNPTSGLLIAAPGLIYGTTSEGGTSNAGTVFSLQLPSTETVLYSFTGGADGGNPFGPLTASPSGVLYGTTRFGGAYGYGCVFQFSPSTGTEQVIYSFSGSPDAYPISGVVIDSSGALYGATFGIPHSNGNFGNIYKLTPGTQWIYTNIHAFVDQTTDAADPVGVTIGPGGVLYGTAFGGAATVFELIPPTWTEKLLGSIGNAYSPVAIGPDGALYGTTYGKFGHPDNAGNVFRVTVK